MESLLILLPGWNAAFQSVDCLLLLPCWKSLAGHGRAEESSFDTLLVWKSDSSTSICLPY